MSWLKTQNIEFLNIVFCSSIAQRGQYEGILTYSVHFSLWSSSKRVGVPIVDKLWAWGQIWAHHISIQSFLDILIWENNTPKLLWYVLCVNNLFWFLIWLPKHLLYFTEVIYLRSLPSESVKQHWTQSISAGPCNNLFRNPRKVVSQIICTCFGLHPVLMESPMLFSSNT